MEIKLEQAYKLLRGCSAVIGEDYALIYPSLAELNGEDENKFMFLSWSNKDGREYYEIFLEGCNRKIDLCGSSLFPVGDCNGDKMQLTLLFTNKLEDQI